MAQGVHPGVAAGADARPLLARRGYFEYSAVTSNLGLSPQPLWNYAAARGAQEKTFGELKSEFAFDVVSTNHYGAKSAWQQISVLSHNLIRSFQLRSAFVEPKPRSFKRSYAYLLRGMKTIRFLVINRAARTARVDGRRALRLTHNPATEILYEQLARRLAA